MDLIPYCTYRNGDSCFRPIYESPLFFQMGLLSVFKPGKQVVRLKEQKHQG